MNRRVILSSLALLALTGLLVWMLRMNWVQAKAHQRQVMTRAAEKKNILPPPPVTPPKPVVPAEYFDVAQRMLFSKDRNPNVIVEVKPPPPKPPLPPFPLYYGQIGLGEPGIFLSTSGSTQKIYHVGDKIGDKDKFVIVGFDLEKITLAFNDETVEKKLDELRPKQTPVPTASVNAAPAPPSAAARTASLAPTPADTTPDKPPDQIVGADYGSGFHGCVSGDTSPAGTIKDGYKKVISQTLFGQSCHWETVK
jgi:hypothetical protein